MYDTRFKGSFKATPIYVYKPRSIRKRTLGSISCNTTTSRPLRPIPLNWVPLELLQGSDSSQITIAPHWSSSYPKYLSSDQDKEGKRRVVWARLHSHCSNLAQRLSEQKKQYLTLHQELNPRMTQAKSSHEPLFRDRGPQRSTKTCPRHLSACLPSHCFSTGWCVCLPQMHGSQACRARDKLTGIPVTTPVWAMLSTVWKFAWPRWWFQVSRFGFATREGNTTCGEEEEGMGDGERGMEERGMERSQDPGSTYRWEEFFWHSVRTEFVARSERVHMPLLKLRW